MAIHTKWLKFPLRILVILFFCYICVSTLFQTKDDFRFIIPYVEFSKQIKGSKALVLDTSVIIDGRIADICDTRIIDTRLIVPRFVLQELQNVADSSDKLRRNRGRRGMDMLKRMQSNPKVDLQIHEGNIPELQEVNEVDQRLVILAKSMSARVVTNDYNLNKVAQLQGVEVININELANAMKSVALPGEVLKVKLIKAWRSDRARRRLPRRWHHGRRRTGPGPYRPGHQHDCHQRVADLGRADDLRQG